MFTGIVEAYGEVKAIEPQGPGMRIVISAPDLALGVGIGDSICVNGCCLTVVKIVDNGDSNNGDSNNRDSNNRDSNNRDSNNGDGNNGDGGWHFDAGDETLSRTNLGKLNVGSRVNLERSLAVGKRMGGHFVTGHIDCVGTLDDRQDDGDWSKFWIRVPGTWTRHMAPKGSVTVDGVSLTLVDVARDRFSLALIPHTLDVTTLGKLDLGDPVNVETDVLAKYVERLTTFESVTPTPPTT